MADTIAPPATATKTDVYDVSQRDDVHKLHRNAVGLIGVLFLVLTGSAPISAMLFNVPIVIGFGNGYGAPAAFLVATIVLTIFSVGYVAMARKVTATGGFYSFISHGLARELGLGSGIVVLVAYSIFEAALAGGFAYFLNLLLVQYLGWHIAWPFLSLFMVAVISVLAYFDVRLSARVLGVGLITEVLILLIFDGGIFGHAGNGSNVQVGALNPVIAFQGFAAHGKLLAGAAGIGLFFAFWSWVGFEMAPNYGEESRDPKRIVPRAMYISVIGLGIFYTLTSWAALSGYSSTDAAINQSQTNASNLFFAASDQFVAHWVTVLLSVLIVTGSFACGMAFHNTAARYFYSLGRERLLPQVLGRTHARWRSPHIASLTQSVIAAAIVVLFAVVAGSNDPNSQAYLQLYGLMSVMGTMVIIFIQALVSLAILVYFERHARADIHWWKTRLAPALAFVSQAVVLYLMISNISFLGSGYGLANWLLPINAAFFLAALGAAFYLRSRQPEKYRLIGRLINSGGV